MINLTIFPKKTLARTLEHLQHLSKTIGQKHLNTFFAEDDQRFKHFSVQYDEITFDFSKHRVDESVISALIDFVQVRGLPTWTKRLFSEEEIIQIGGNKLLEFWKIFKPMAEQLGLFNSVN